MDNKLFVSASPHIVKTDSVRRIMWQVNLALLPAAAASIFIFGPRAAWVMLTGIVSALATEALILKGRGQKVVISDGSAFMTGLLLAFNLPAHAPLWMVAIGGIFSIAIAKQAFGGIGCNIFNPALAGRAFLMAAWPQHMTSFTKPFVYDAVTQATPLMLLKEDKAQGIVDMGLNYWDLFVGNRGGSLGEVCILLLLVGAAFLFLRGLITWHTPVTYIATVAVMARLFGSPAGLGQGDVLLHILSGGLILGAFFMATDYVTSPITRKGQIVFGVGCGLLTSVIRIWGGYPEGVCYAILIMNSGVPLIDRFVKPRVYGTGRST